MSSVRRWATLRIAGGLRRVCGTLAICLCAALLAIPAPAAIGTSAGPGARPSVRIMSQTFSVSPDSEISIQLEIGTDGAPDRSDVAVAISLAPAAESRTAVAAISDNSQEPRFRIGATEPLAALESTSEHGRNLRLKAVPGALGAGGTAGVSEERSLAFPGDGVYPAVIELKKISDPRGQALASARTWFAYLARPPERPLRVGFVWPVGMRDPGRDSSGAPTANFLQEISEGGRLRRVAALAATSAVPLSLEIVPETISDLIEASRSTKIEAARREDAGVVLQSLQVAARRSANELPAVPYARPPTSVYADEEFTGDLDAQVSLGRTVTLDGLGISPTADIAIAPDGPLDQDCVEKLVHFGATRIVVDEARLKPVPGTRPGSQPSQPFLLAGSEAPVTAMAPDARLSEIIAAADPLSPPELAYRALAEVAAAYFEAPSAGRGIAISPGAGWAAPEAAMSQFLAGLKSSPMVSAQSVGQIFDETPLATGRRRAPLLRETLGEKLSPVPAGTAFVAARQRLAGFESVLVEPNPLPADLRAQILAAQGAGPLSDGGQGAREMLGAVVARTDDELALIRIPVSSGITLTSRDGVVPVRIENGADYPVRVALWLESEHLRFPDHHDGEPFVLVPPGETREIRVVAGATGVFPLRARLTSPDGAFSVADSRLSVRSTGASSAALLIAVGAAGFLLIWWGRELTKSRRENNG